MVPTCGGGVEWSRYSKKGTAVPPLPNLTVERVSEIIAEASDVAYVAAGGMKRVYKGTIGGTTYALKFTEGPDTEGDLEDFENTDTAIRAKREVETMRECDCPHMVKLGPIGLTFVEFDGQRLIYFTEEFVDGKDLKMILREHGRLLPADVIRLGLHIGRAIDALWKMEKIHRDIKPANVMCRTSNGDFVLLDAGLVFDLGAETVSVGPVGTRPYFSPEQFDFSNRRTVMDFRSDLFSLGVTMYEMLTGVHPFWEQGDSLASLYNKIVTMPAQPPQERCEVPDELNEIILRLLGKSPHLRYRRCEMLLDALEKISS